MSKGIFIYSFYCQNASKLVESFMHRSVDHVLRCVSNREGEKYTPLLQTLKGLKVNKFVICFSLSL